MKASVTEVHYIRFKVGLAGILRVYRLGQACKQERAEL